MSHNALLEYIRQAKDCNASDTQIHERLHAAGWYRVDIQDAFELYRKITTPVPEKDCEPAPRPTVADRMMPRSYDSHIIAVAALSFTIGFIAFLWLVR